MRGVLGAWYDFIRFLAKSLVFWLTGGLKVVGSDNLPGEGPVIVAANHLSHLDPPAVACASRRRLTFMARKSLFKNRAFGWLISSVGAFPVRRGEADTEAVRLSLRLLGEGRAVLMFPEGTRGDGKSLGPISSGIAMLASRSGAAVVPVGLVGTHDKLPRGSKSIRRGRVTVVFGSPFTYEEVAEGISVPRVARERFAAELTRRILEACKTGGLELTASAAESPSRTTPQVDAANEHPTPESV